MNKIIAKLEWTWSTTLQKRILDIYIKSEYDQEIPQSHTSDQTTAPWGRATEH